MSVAGTPTKELSAAAPAAENQNTEANGNRFLFFYVVPSWMVSFVTHVAIIIILALYFLPQREEKKVALTASEAASALEESIDLNVDLNVDEATPLESEAVEPVASDVSEVVETPLPEVTTDFGNMMGAVDSVEAELTTVSSFETTSEMSGRGEAAKSEALKKYGGTAASEEAVALALKWIIAHQLPDGGWSFDHQRGPGSHRSSPNPGAYSEGRNGATAIALLPLLGAGQTHKNGEYREQIEKGILFLLKNGKAKGKGISYWEEQGTMYSHGLAAIVLNEAYAMTKDPDLAPFAQGSLNFIESAQDPVGGGWRYKPREPGDTSAVGWQMMAIKSGYSSGLKVNPRVIKLTEKFLDSVSSSGGAFYGYMDKPNGQPADARTTIGILCRMYMGWAKDAPGIVDGVAALSKRGPRIRNELDSYYNYYGTQVMKQYGGKAWTDWNNVMRETLVKTQIKEGPAAGSWDPGSTYADSKGGRLYGTCLSCMTLEVYYRYLPIYGEEASSEEFKLD